MSFFGYLNLNFVFFLNLFFGGEEGGRCVHCFCCHFWDVNFCWMLSLRVTRCRGANFGDAVVSCLCHSGGLGEYLWRGATGEWDVKEVVKNIYHGWWVEKHLSLPSWILIRRKFQFHFNNFSSQPGISPSSPRFCSYKLTWKREKTMSMSSNQAWLVVGEEVDSELQTLRKSEIHRLLRNAYTGCGLFSQLTGWRCRVWIGVKRNGKLLESENSWSVSHVKLFLSNFPFLTYNWKILKDNKMILYQQVNKAFQVSNQL